MPAVCSQCSHVSDGAGPCPRCGASPALGGANTPLWQQTGWGRALIGLIIGQGLFYGLKQLLTAGLLAAQGGAGEDLWRWAPNVIALGSLQLFAVLIGGVFAGGGQNGGLGHGAISGAWNGVLAVLLQQLPGDTLGTSALYALPVAHAVVGAVGGLIGALIWRPVVLQPEPELSAPRKPAQRKSKPLLAGPVAWFRVALGTAIAVAGALYASRLLDWIGEVSRGRLVTTSTMQDNVLTWELRAIALLLGGAFAGALTRNGLKQGLFVGIFASMALITLQSAKGGAWMELALFTAVGTTALALAGGWFGGQILPPVVAGARRASPQM